ncbi:precorrin-6y C5,15-methyltransferase (decarboxylating) subunit CbiE [Planktothrix sp. FACHB-1355]|uniref:Precorrin-6y C5,15-methyltransferase (Decarboxylating) subunit CbiE n=1 Tax=Aerosakkonema funiforme FACHB-1375 TaxID=2949571 RepID=A0A926VG16_9CYAN|nr:MULTISPECIES: precorrin-6y C5,15-methyltransferase (decarboxylating) subunit CbiE [Oscillatoriales]MBD2183043.1 precorrin-6y C5,15-methyltransferase (decarboxylating) subunit CbiE [Aerosakkonema funiforme FACHB-1375]MBD3557773.1 precorrin-6y C5,15-methyltransferase (decarboxylating) subunit CbiE [Planktothrix sp. FACHB-1355]
MTVHIVGIGLDGAAGLTETVRQIVDRATVLVGSDRHLSYFSHHAADRILLGDFTVTIRQIRQRLSTGEVIVVLVTGDPLFFGLGRLLLMELPTELLSFHPHLSSIQLAFNRIKVPWQDACAISVHGRAFDELILALQQGVEKVAVLTDDSHSPSAIARLLLSLDLPSQYQFWICENLGGVDERVRCLPIADVLEETFAPLNVVVLHRQKELTAGELNLQSLPMLGLPDSSFASFSDRPGLMTKREIRTLILAELALQPGQTIWDVGAGTGSVSIEIARLFPTSSVYAVEKTSAGTALIEENCRRFQVSNVISIHGKAPDILYRLAQPDRIFIGGSGGNLIEILGICGGHLISDGVLVLALATIEHLNIALKWLSDTGWNYQLLQVQLSRSVSVGSLTRFAPLNPVTIITARKK